MTRLDFGGEDDLNQLRDQTGLVHDQFGDHTGTTTLQQGYEQGDTRRGLVAYYPFDGDVNDATPLGNDGTDNTSAGYVTGQVGSQAKDFDASNNDYINFSPPDSNRATWAFWLNLDAIDPDSDDDFYLQRDGSTNNRILVRLDSSDSSGAQGDIVSTASGTAAAVDFTIPSVDAWTHICATYDGSSLRGYIDGVVVGSATLGGDLESPQSDLYAMNSVAQTRPTDGQMDDFRIYDRALSQPEIQALANLTETETINNEDVLQ